MTPAVGRDTTTACGISGRIQYRPHNADRSERRLLNVLPRTEKPSPPRGRCRRSRRMRCRLRVAEPFTGEKVTLFSVTRCRATPHHRLRAQLSRCGSVRRGSRSPPETDSLPRPCFAALKGKPRLGSCRADCRLMCFSPNTETFSAVHNISVVCLSHLARSPGGLGGRSRIEFIMWPPLSAAT